MSTSSQIDVLPVALDEIQAMRDEYRREMACQIVHESWHRRGFTSSYALRVRGDVVGYGSVGGAPRDEEHVVKEFFVRAPHRADALPLFRALVAATAVLAVEAQTNDVLLLLMLLDCAADLTTETILFADGITTTLDAPAPDAIVRRLAEADRAHVFAHVHEPVGEWGLEIGGEIVATGGLATHYNPPYADVYMEVAGTHRRRGLGSYLVQELKRLGREDGLAPAARCHHANVASRRTLQRAGMFPCARIVRARLA